MSPQASFRPSSSLHSRGQDQDNVSACISKACEIFVGPATFVSEQNVRRRTQAPKRSAAALRRKLKLQSLLPLLLPLLLLLLFQLLCRCFSATDKKSKSTSGGGPPRSFCSGISRHLHFLQRQAKIRNSQTCESSSSAIPTITAASSRTCNSDHRSS